MHGSVVWERGVRAWYESVVWERGMGAWYESVVWKLGMGAWYGLRGSRANNRSVGREQRGVDVSHI